MRCKSVFLIAHPSGEDHVTHLIHLWSIDPFKNWKIALHCRSSWIDGFTRNTLLELLQRTSNPGSSKPTPGKARPKTLVSCILFSPTALWRPGELWDRSSIKSVRFSQGLIASDSLGVLNSFWNFGLFKMKIRFPGSPKQLNPEDHRGGGNKYYY